MICQLCGNEFECGAENKAAKCWCFDLPHVRPLPVLENNQNCLCPNCLKHNIEQSESIEDD